MTRYRLTGSDLTRTVEDDDGNERSQVFRTGDEFEPTDAELQAFGDMLEPAEDDAGAGAGSVQATQPIPETAQAEYEGTPHREIPAATDEDDIDEPTHRPADQNAYESEDGEHEQGAVETPVPEGTNVEYAPTDEEGEPVPDDERRAEAEVAAVEETPAADAETEDADEAHAVPDGYDDWHVPDVQSYLDEGDSDTEELDAMYEYETENKNRTSVLSAIETQRSASTSAADETEGATEPASADEIASAETEETGE